MIKRYLIAFCLIAITPIIARADAFGNKSAGNPVYGSGFVTVTSATIPSGSPFYIQNGSAHQTATANIDSMTVSGQMTVGTLQGSTATITDVIASTVSASSATFKNLSITQIQGVTPSLVPGTNITSITGTWPNQTINATTQGGSGGGIVSPATFTWINNFGMSLSTLNVTGLSTLSTVTITSAAIMGTTTNDNACVGCVGEYISSTTLGTNLPNGNANNTIVSIVLSSGDWDVTGVAEIDNNGSTGVTAVQLVLSNFSGNTNTDQVIGDNAVRNFAPTSVTTVGLVVPSWRRSISTTTTIYLKGAPLGGLSGGPPQANARLSARRTR